MVKLIKPIIFMILLFMFIFLSACFSQNEPKCDSAGKCPNGWVCETSTNRCVTSLGDGGNDAAVDGSSDTSYPSDGSYDVSDASSDGSYDGSDASFDAAADSGDASTDTSYPPDGSTDAGPDSGFDAGGAKVTAVEGTGTISAINPRPEDLTFWNAHIADRTAAVTRISGTAKALNITGNNLLNVTKVTLKGQSGQGDHEMTITAKTQTSITAIWPTVLTTGGLFNMEFQSASGDTQYQVYIMRGEQGPKGDKGQQGSQGLQGDIGLTGDKGIQGNQGSQGSQGTKGPKGNPGQFTGVITGDTTVSGSLTVTSASVTSLAVSNTYVLPPCPDGYAKDPRSDITLCKRGSDQMARVGDFWIDQYEGVIVDEAAWNNGYCNGAGTSYGQSSYNYPGTFPRTGDWTGELYACSKSGIKPSAYMTWFQAQEACALSGKRLCTNEEWQAAAAGTYDTGGTETGTQCHIKTTNTSARNTGLAGSNPGGTDSCISRWGAEDMIGNLNEWVAVWGQAGPDNSVANGAYAGTFGSGKGFDGFSPETSGDGDGTWNLAGAAYGCNKSGGNCGFKVGLPFTGVRGVSWAGGPQAGVFALNLSNSPSYPGFDLGFRCCRGR